MNCMIWKTSTIILSSNSVFIFENQFSGDKIDFVAQIDSHRRGIGVGFRQLVRLVSRRVIQVLCEGLQ